MGWTGHTLLHALFFGLPKDITEAKAFFEYMPFPVHIQWTNGPAIIELLKGQEKNGLDLLGTPGKGWAVWQGIGIATRKSEIVAIGIIKPVFHSRCDKTTNLVFGLRAFSISFNKRFSRSPVSVILHRIFCIANTSI